MQLNGTVKYVESGMKTALKGMQIESAFINLTNENVIGFDKVGYQRKEIMSTSFAEYLGRDGLATTVDDKTGRIQNSPNPLDLALSTKGYFQTKNSDGIKMTRDGRFKLDKDGYLLALDNSNVLSNVGTPIKLPFLPENLEQIKINVKGDVSILNKKLNKLEKVATIGVVDANGAMVMSPEVRQGYNEHSNVSLEREFLGMMGPLRNFAANRQMFMIENSILSKTISQLGATS